MEPGTAYLSSLLWLPKTSVSLRLLRASLTFNPISTSKLAKQSPVYAWADSRDHIGVPIYTFGDIHSEKFQGFFRKSALELIDNRPKTFEPVDIKSLIQLDVIQKTDVQKKAVDALMRNESGILVLSCGSGKTVITLHAAAQYQVPFIIVVDSKGLQEQWASEIRTHLRTSTGEHVDVGFVGDGKEEWNKPIVIALVQTLYRMAQEGEPSQKIRDRFGIVIYDEVQIMGAPQFVKAVTLFSGRRWSLSATPRRADGLEKMYYLHLGEPIMTYLHQELRPAFLFYRTRHQINPADPQYKAYVMLYGETNVSKLFSYLAGLLPRTYEIVGLIRQGMEQGRKILVLSSRLFLLQQLKTLIPEAGVITGAVKGLDRESVRQKSDVLLCQLKLGEKALNKRELDMLVVCEPFRRMETFQQIVGRVQRVAPGKQYPFVLFIEDGVGPCRAMCRKLRRLITTWPADQGGPYTWDWLGGEGGEDGRAEGKPGPGV